LNKAIEEEILYLQSDKCFWLPVFTGSLEARQQYFFNAAPLATRDLCTPATAIYYKGFQRKTAGTITTLVRCTLCTDIFPNRVGPIF